MAPAREGARRTRDETDVTERARDERGRPRQKASQDGTGKRLATPSIGARRVARRAAEQISELTGRAPESIGAVAREGGEWKVAVEVVEMHRIPDSADIMAIYNVDLNSRGELVTFHRERRYIRGSTEGAK
jgi:hypothetical protein